VRLAAALVERSRGKHGESFPGWGDVVIFAACTAAASARYRAAALATSTAARGPGRCADRPTLPRAAWSTRAPRASAPGLCESEMMA
jgi:hypothetical protein